MNYKIILTCVIIIIISLSINANEKAKIINPEGKLKFKSLVEVSDEKKNVFMLHENPFISKLSPSFLHIFTRSDNNLIRFTNYTLYVQMTNSMINSGISSALGSLFSGGMTIVFSVLYYNITSLILFSVFSGVFLIGAFILFPIAGYFYNKAKKTLMDMIDEYNTNLNQGAMNSNQIKVDLFSFRLGKAKPKASWCELLVEQAGMK